MQDTAALPVLVAGAGPAGCFVARALAERDVDVVLVDPTLAPWANRLSVFTRHLAPWALPDDALARQWAAPTLRDDTRHVNVGAEYALLDNDRLQRHLVGHPRIQLCQAQVRSVDDDGRVLLDDGNAVHAAVVIDATGAQSSLSQRTAPFAAQVAFGGEVHAALPFDDDGCMLMDWRAPGGPDLGLPSFLYALSLGPDHWFVEETLLWAPLPVDDDVMERLRLRLDARLQTLTGRAALDVAETEHCFIPLGAALSSTSSDTVVPIGAAAGLVHPTSGYSVGTSMELAPKLADLVVTHRQLAPAELGARLRDEVLPPSRRRRFALLQRMSPALGVVQADEMVPFFGSFFRREGWQSVMSGATPALPPLAAAAAGSFRTLSWRSKWRLLQAVCAPGVSPDETSAAVQT